MSKQSKVKNHIDYLVMAQAIANAALSRRAALQMELAVSLVHFTQEIGGTDTTGKANLKAVYNSAGYLCMTKQDRDYKTVNRRLNAMAKAFDKIGSSVVHGWMEGKTDTQVILDSVQGELLAFGFDTLDDVLDYVGVETNRSRPARQPAGPVTTPAAANDDAKGEEEAPAPAPAIMVTMEQMYDTLTANFNADELREFCTKLLVHVAEVETAADQKAA